MKNVFGLVVLLFSIGAQAYQVGDPVEGLCFNNLDSREKSCSENFLGKVLVLVYSAGWCGPCHNFMSQLAPASKKYSSEQVQFVSLSCQGSTQGSYPTDSYLNYWKNLYSIPFKVGASPYNCGNKFNQQFIPNVAIIDTLGKLNYAGTNPTVTGVFSRIDGLLPSDNE